MFKRGADKARNPDWSDQGDARMIRVAQLSFWFLHADEFCRRAKETPGVELVGCWDSNKERGRSKAREFDIPFFGELQELLEVKGLAAVSICSEPLRTPDLVEAASRAGKHSMVEKPMAGSLADAARILEAAQRHRVQVMPAFNLRFNPAAEYVKELLVDGVAGNIVRVRHLHGHSLNYERAEFKEPQISDTMTDRVPLDAHRQQSLFWSGAHSALWYLWMFGPPRSIQSTTWTVSEGLSIEDNSLTILRYDDFAGTMECSETLLVQPTVAEIYGTEGVIFQYRGNLPSTRVASETAAPVGVFRRSTNSLAFPDIPPHFLRHESRYSSAGRFLLALLEEEPWPIDVSEGYASIALLAAAEQSALKGREVPFALDYLSGSSDLEIRSTHE